MSNPILAQFMNELLSGRLKLVDLTQTLAPEFPTIVLPPEFGQAWPFRIEEISRYDERGPAWYWNNLKLGEHTGTHFDAPIHWVTGKDYADGATDTVAVKRFIAPAVVIDCSKEAAADEKFVCEPSHIAAFEAKHGYNIAAVFETLRRPS